jgi:hypothetical protein
MPHAVATTSFTRSALLQQLIQRARASKQGVTQQARAKQGLHGVQSYPGLPWLVVLHGIVINMTVESVLTDVIWFTVS